MFTIEEIHITINVPSRLPDSNYLAMKRTLNSKRFQTNLRGEVRKIVRRSASLKKAHVRIGSCRRSLGRLSLHHGWCSLLPKKRRPDAQVSSDR